jgi:hypothetical protein
LHHPSRAPFSETLQYASKFEKSIAMVDACGTKEQLFEFFESALPLIHETKPVSGIHLNYLKGCEAYAITCLRLQDIARAAKIFVTLWLPGTRVRPSGEAMSNCPKLLVSPLQDEEIKAADVWSLLSYSIALLCAGVIANSKENLSTLHGPHLLEGRRIFKHIFSKGNSFFVGLDIFFLMIVICSLRHFRGWKLWYGRLSA